MFMLIGAELHPNLIESVIKSGMTPPFLQEHPDDISTRPVSSSVDLPEHRLEVSDVRSHALLSCGKRLSGLTVRASAVSEQ